MNEITIEQAIMIRSRGENRLLARSPGFSDEWEEEAGRLAAGFGERPAGSACPAAVFARPFGKLHVAVVQVADLPVGAGTGAEGLGFYFLVIPHEAYRNLWGDPFVLADRAPPPWHQRGQLPALTWPADPLPPRTLGEVRRVLQKTKTGALAENEEIPADWNRGDVADPEQSLGPALLGGVQVLVDGGKLVFERPQPDPELVRGLWTLLPTRTRSELWPASFAFSNALGFDALVVPPVVRAGEEFPHYTTEDQACDYPQGYYELNLQVAAESGNQGELDRLLNRRSSRETLKLALVLLVGLALLAVALSWNRSPAPRKPPDRAERRARATTLAGAVGTATAWQALGLIGKPREKKGP